MFAVVKPEKKDTPEDRERRKKYKESEAQKQDPEVIKQGGYGIYEDEDYETSDDSVDWIDKDKLDEEEKKR